MIQKLASWRPIIIASGAVAAWVAPLEPLRAATDLD